MSLLEIMTTAMLWLAEGIFNLWVSRPGDRDFQRHLQGLWSGMLLTTFKNTTSCDAYDRTVESILIQWYFEFVAHGRKRVLGDDLRAITRDDWSALLYCSHLDELGLDAQKSKQGVSKRQGEYLRIIFSSSQAYGSPDRILVPSWMYDSTMVR